MSHRPAELQPKRYLFGSEEAAASLTGAPQRVALWILDWNFIGLQWVRTAGAAGSGAIVVYGTGNKELAEAGGTDPATNRWWKQLPAAQQFATNPAAAAGSDLLSLAWHGLDGILVEVTPTGTLDNFYLTARLRGEDSR